jgi:hypothetical protein
MCIEHSFGLLIHTLTFSLAALLTPNLKSCSTHIVIVIECSDIAKLMSTAASAASAIATDRVLVHTLHLQASSVCEAVGHKQFRHKPCCGHEYKQLHRGTVAVACSCTTLANATAVRQHT